MSYKAPSHHGESPFSCLFPSFGHLQNICPPMLPIKSHMASIIGGSPHIQGKQRSIRKYPVVLPQMTQTETTFNLKKYFCQTWSSQSGPRGVTSGKIFTWISILTLKKTRVAKVIGEPFWLKIFAETAHENTGHELFSSDHAGKNNTKGLQS